MRAFLDDIYVTTSPARPASVLSRLEHHLFASLHIRLHAGEGSTTWVGDPDLPPQDRGLRVLGSPWERTSTSLRSSSTFPCSTVLSSSCSLAYMACKSRGYCCCSVRLLACTTVFGCSHLHSQLCSLPNMTATFCAASPSCFTLCPARPIPCPSPRPRAPTCPCAMADLVSAVRLSTRQQPTSPPGLTRLEHSESVSLTPVTSSLACLMTQHLAPHCS